LATAEIIFAALFGQYGFHAIAQFFGYSAYVTLELFKAAKAVGIELVVTSLLTGGLVLFRGSRVGKTSVIAFTTHVVAVLQAVISNSSAAFGVFAVTKALCAYVVFVAVEQIDNVLPWQFRLNNI
jgi:hypothetical protein